MGRSKVPMNGEDLTKSLRRTPPHTVGRSFLYFLDHSPSIRLRFSGHRDDGVGHGVVAVWARCVFDPYTEVHRAGCGSGAVPVVGRPARVALQQLPRARSLPASPELIARVGAAGGGRGECDLGA